MRTRRNTRRRQRTARFLSRPCNRATAALNGDDATYTRLEAQIARLTDQRDVIAQKMITMLEGAGFDNRSIDEGQARTLIAQAEAPIDSVH